MTVGSGRQEFDNGMKISIVWCFIIIRFKKISDFTTNSALKETLNLLYAVPFLPVTEVQSGWNDIKQELLSRFPHTSNFVSYYESTWLTGNYDIELWNCHLQTLAGLPRTNNTSEGGNHSINVAFGCSKPSIWKCLDRIKEFQSQTDLVMVQHLVGQSNSVPPRKKWLAREEQIKGIVEQYSSGNDTTAYLRRLSFLFGH